MMRITHFKLIVLLVTIALSVACSKDSKPLPDSPVKWMGLKEGIVKATAEKKLIFVDLYADWCGPCKYMDATTYQDSTVADFLNTHFVPVKIDADSKELIPCESNQPAEPMECAGQIWQVQGLPGTIILDAQGYFLTSTMGIQEATGLLESLKLLLKEKEKLLTLVESEKTKIEKAQEPKK